MIIANAYDNYAINGEFNMEPSDSSLKEFLESNILLY